MRLSTALLPAIAAAFVLVASCGKGGGNTGGGTLCDPGENIFCRCPGGEAGTKMCKADGMSFEACVTREGPCPEIPMSTSATSTTTSTTSTGTGGGGGGTPGALYDACGMDADCASSKCLYGFCTTDCAKFDECELGTGECVQIMGNQICLPVCDVTASCEGWYGAPSTCGYTAAVDGTPVTTCADWKDTLQVPPAGSDCMDDVACNLGNGGVQAVCAFGACTKGCYQQSDCPPNTTCSSAGATLGSCK